MSVYIPIRTREARIPSQNDLSQIVFIIYVPTLGVAQPIMSWFFLGSGSKMQNIQEELTSYFTHCCPTSSSWIIQNINRNFVTYIKLSKSRSWRKVGMERWESLPSWWRWSISSRHWYNFTCHLWVASLFIHFYQLVPSWPPQRTRRHTIFQLRYVWVGHRRI